MTIDQHAPAGSSGHRAPQLALTSRPHQHPQPLAALAAPGRAITVLKADDSDTAVVLAHHADTGTVDVLIDGQVDALPADLAAVAVADPATAVAVTRQAVAWVVAARDAAAERTRELANELTEQQHRHDGILAAIRAYAIDRHLADEICQDGLNRFLTHFGLEPYEARHRVTFTIEGSFDVIPVVARDASEIANDVRAYLRLDTDEVDDVDGDSIAIDVTEVEVEDRDA